MAPLKEIITERENVTSVRLGDRTITLVGTAHVSRASAELVSEIVTSHQPDALCIELCAARYQALQDPDRWRNTDIFEVVRSGRTYVLLTQIILSAFQRRLAKQFGVRPGEEMLTAMQLSRERNIPLSLVDRDVKITLKRAWSQAGLLGLLRITTSLVTSFFTSEEFSEKDIEALKEGDALALLMSEFSDLLPGVKVALIDERDSYMAQKIEATPGDHVVAVLGAGHIPGITRALGQGLHDQTELERIPPKSAAIRCVHWAIPAALLIVVVLAIRHSGVQGGLHALAAFALANAAGTLLGALLAAAHPLTLLGAAISAPFAALHAAGWFCALIECWLRRPQVDDFEKLSDDLASVRGWWRNRISHIFLVLLLSNIGSTIGCVLGLSYLSWRL